MHSHNYGEKKQWNTAGKSPYLRQMNTIQQK